MGSGKGLAVFALIIGISGLGLGIYSIMQIQTGVTGPPSPTSNIVGLWESLSRDMDNPDFNTVNDWLIEVGDAKITKAYDLPSRQIIHTVGPIWKGGIFNEKELLASCYLKSLELSRQYQCISIAFPNISTGVYHFPKKEAAKIALETIETYTKSNSLPQVIYMVCFDDENYQIYNEFLKQ